MQSYKSQEHHDDESQVTCLVDVVEPSGDLRVKSVVDEKFVVLGSGAAAAASDAAAAAVALLRRVKTVPVFAFLGLICHHGWKKNREDVESLQKKIISIFQKDFQVLLLI